MLESRQRRNFVAWGEVSDSEQKPRNVIPLRCTESRSDGIRRPDLGCATNSNPRIFFQDFLNLVLFLPVLISVLALC
jgi:hypothetical protein